MRNLTWGVLISDFGSHCQLPTSYMTFKEQSIHLHSSASPAVKVDSTALSQAASERIIP